MKGRSHVHKLVESGARFVVVHFGRNFGNLLQRRRRVAQMRRIKRGQIHRTMNRLKRMGILPRDSLIGRKARTVSSSSDID